MNLWLVQHAYNLVSSISASQKAPDRALDLYALIALCPAPYIKPPNQTAAPIFLKHRVSSLKCKNLIFFPKFIFTYYKQHTACNDMHAP